MSVNNYDNYLSYFNRNVLSRYRNDSHLYSLDEDDMGGALKVRDSATSLLEEGTWFDIQFGFRRLEDDRICLAVFHKDILDLPSKDQQIWESEHIGQPRFQADDPSFHRWVQRYLEGSWEIEDGPKVQVRRYVLLINALTRQIIGEQLFRSADHRLINYPVAENTDAYDKAHLELYRVIVDGLNSKCLSALAKLHGIELTNPNMTLNSLKEILPAELIPYIHQPFKPCRSERNDNHGIPADFCAPFPAFQTFRNDLASIAEGLGTLLKWLETLLSASAEKCEQRENAMAHLLPKIVGMPLPEFKLGKLKEAEGKTIRSIEYGVEESHPDLHEREGIILHFTDGSTLGISIGSNAYHIASEFTQLSPSDIHTDLMVFWAPSISSDDQYNE